MRSIDMCDVTRDRLTFRPLFSYRSIGLFRIEIFLSFFCSGRPFQVRSFYTVGRKNYLHSRAGNVELFFSEEVVKRDDIE